MKLKFKLPSDISSSQDITELIFELKEYNRWLSQNSILKRVSKKKVPEPPKISSTAIEIIRSWQTDKQASRNNINDLITSIEKIKSSAPTMTVTLAAVPGKELKKKIVDWCRNNISPNILVIFQFNATILGGMVVKYGSHIFDWSFRRQILANKNKFPEILRNV